MSTNQNCSNGKGELSMFRKIESAIACTIAAVQLGSEWIFEGVETRTKRSIKIGLGVLVILGMTLKF